MIRLIATSYTPGTDMEGYLQLSDGRFIVLHNFEEASDFIDGSVGILEWFESGDFIRVINPLTKGILNLTFITPSYVALAETAESIRETRDSFKADLGIPDESNPAPTDRELDRPLS